MYAYWQFLRTQAALLGFGFLCVFWGNFGQSFFLGWYGNAIKSDLNISAQQYGAVYSLATMASAATVVWAGALIDRVPLKTYVILVASGLCAAALVMANVSNIWLLALGFFGLRLFGQALLPHTGITTIHKRSRQGDEHCRQRCALGRGFVAGDGRGAAFADGMAAGLVVGGSVGARYFCAAGTHVSAPGRTFDADTGAG